MISDAAGVARLGDSLAFGIAVPDCDPFVAPLLYAIPIQLLAYHTAVIKGTDLDHPATSPKASRWNRLVALPVPAGDQECPTFQLAMVCYPFQGYVFLKDICLTEFDLAEPGSLSYSIEARKTGARRLPMRRPLEALSIKPG